jgi:hypothetical protein
VKWRWFFQAVAVAFLLASAYHAWRILVPVAVGSSPARHALFVAIDLGCAVGLWKRPRWFAWGFGVLVAQQLFSHGGAAMRAWSGRHAIDAVSLAIVVLLPTVWAAMLREPRRKAPALDGDR